MKKVIETDLYPYASHLQGRDTPQDYKKTTIKIGTIISKPTNNPSKPYETTYIERPILFQKTPSIEDIQLLQDDTIIKTPMVYIHIVFDDKKEMKLYFLSNIESIENKTFLYTQKPRDPYKNTYKKIGVSVTEKYKIPLGEIYEDTQQTLFQNDTIETQDHETYLYSEPQELLLKAYTRIIEAIKDAYNTITNHFQGTNRKELIEKLSLCVIKAGYPSQLRYKKTA